MVYLDVYSYRSSVLGMFCSNFILLWTASNACASVRQMSLACVCMCEKFNVLSKEVWEQVEVHNLQ